MEIFHKMISRVELSEWAYKIQILKKELRCVSAL